MEKITVTRMGIDTLAERKLFKEEVETDALCLSPWINFVFQILERSKEEYDDLLTPIRLHTKWQRTPARHRFGKPDCTYRGRHYYRLYCFHAQMETESGTWYQNFVLWADPDNSGKGSGIELVKMVAGPSYDDRLILPFIKWLHLERKKLLDTFPVRGWEERFERPRHSK